MYKCKICSKEFKALTNTHLVRHNLTIEEYCRKFPEEIQKVKIFGKSFKKKRIPWNKNLVFVQENYYTKPGYYEKIRKDILKRDNNKCQRCGSKINLIVHHKIPIPKGKSIPENLITLCRTCHRKDHSVRCPFYRFVATKTMEFEAGHYLENYKGLCKNQHGHNYKIEVSVGSDDLNEQGMVVDFGKIKEKMSDVLDSLDHQNLNDIIDFNPTAENIAWYIYYSLKGNLEGLLSVKIYETSDSSITYTQYNNLESFSTGVVVRN